MRKLPHYILSFCIFLFFGISGVFTAAGISALIWGSEVLDKELGNSPEGFTPQMVVFLSLMIFFMLYGFLSSLLTILIPYFVKFDLNVHDSPQNKKILQKLVGWYVEKLYLFNEKMKESEPVDADNPFKPPRNSKNQLDD